MRKIVLVLAGTVLAPEALLAQAADTQIPPPREAALEEIAVTARKREESVIDAPLAISAFTNADLTAKGLRDISEVALFTPGFWMQNIQGGTEQPFIRGMSSPSFERDHGEPSASDVLSRCAEHQNGG